MDEDSPRPCSHDDLGPPGTDDTTSTNLKHVLIKWTGSKRRQAKQIVAKFPRKIATYYEPFLGGGSVLYELLGTDIEVGRIECSDACEPLIALWQVVQDDPNGLVEEYIKNWRLLQVSGAAYYREARQAFNESHDPHLFFFLLRTCRNGLVRFNRDGEFNSGFHGARPGMDPETVRLIVEDWGRRLSSKDVRFSVRDYRQVTTQEGDLLYLDPPYDAREGYYYSGKFDFGELFGWLRKQQGDHLLSLNGFLGDDDRRLEVPADLYDRHRLLDNGNNPFDRLDGRLPRLVTESLYIKRRGASPKAKEDVPHQEPAPPIPNQNSKSAEIRSLLEAEPDLSGPEVVRRLTERGIEVDANLVRVVRHHARKANQWESRWCEAVCREVERRLNSMLALSFSDNVRVTHDELMSLAELIGSGVSEDHLFYLARALWVVQYARLTGQSAGTVEAEIARRARGVKTTPDVDDELNEGDSLGNIHRLNIMDTI